MDIDFMKSSAEDQMEMMLMQIDKLPDFSPNYEIPNMMEFSSHNNIINNITCNNNNKNDAVLENLNLSSPIAFTTLHHHHHPTISFSGRGPSPPPPYLHSGEFSGAQKRSSMAAMREMIFRIASMQSIHIDPESVKPPKRRNVKISTDPQSVAARHRRERISERIRILQRLVPGGTKMDTASMLDEAIHYVKFLKNQVRSLERVAANGQPAAAGVGFPVPMSSGSGYFPAGGKAYRQMTSSYNPNVQHMADA